MTAGRSKECSSRGHASLPSQHVELFEIEMMKARLLCTLDKAEPPEQRIIHRRLATCSSNESAHEAARARMIGDSMSIARRSRHMSP